jgi:predicted permease
MREMLNKKGVYVASILRLTAIPAVLIAALFALKTLANLAFGLAIDNTVLFLCFFAVATPLGLNTVVFPESFGGNPKTGASMALISHTIGVLSLPLLFALMTFLFGKVA